MIHAFQGDAWGMAPGALNWRPPLEVAAPDPAAVHAAEKTIPLWADLTYPDDTRHKVKAFAQAWTDTAVRIQWVEKSLARYAWVSPVHVRHRQLEGRG